MRDWNQLESTLQQQGRHNARTIASLQSWESRLQSIMSSLKIKDDTSDQMFRWRMHNTRLFLMNALNERMLENVDSYSQAENSILRFVAYSRCSCLYD